ncbi:hypothetical protein K1719_036060 [Acacia pycnantha]|nr:hypothetical protein K1719_036060 [Acacia pycnantha]
MQGWREYFHKMNEQDSQRVQEETDKEESQATGRMEGKPGALKFSVKNILHGVCDLQCNIAAWIRLPDVPFEFYNVESLRRIGNMVGKMIKIDRSTSIYDKGGFARICVELDLTQPLLPTYVVFGEERPIIYEGLHRVCFNCGKYGHQKVECPLCQPSSSEQKNGSEDINSGNNQEDNTDGEQQNGSEDINSGNKQEANTDGEKEKLAVGVKDAVTGGQKVVTGGADEGGSPFGKLRMLRRESRGVFNRAGSRQGINGDIKTQVDHDISGIKIIPERMIVKKDAKQGKNVNKGASIIEKGPPKTEWIQIGSKRKNVNGGKMKGKENRPPGRERVQRLSNLGLALEPIHGNPFHVLQESEPNAINPGLEACMQIKTCGRPGPPETQTVMQDNNMELGSECHNESQLCNLNSLKGIVTSQDNELTPQHDVDATMKDQDKSEEELGTPPTTLPVS